MRVRIVASGIVCPTCKGRGYVREEDDTRIVPAHELRAMRFPEEAPTKPDTPSVMVRAHKKRHRGLFLLYAALAVGGGVLLGLVLFYLTRC